ncbi:hypothetical protein KPH14_005631 [Odynerus spinipes]|uniref:Uncharacterized protein n=1 Tax=Odynerus spinipes TaxID=1348599 RepID=A0AAD9RB85_9HYME|nr:hypothetical protein KPH14_005631 [Odynerus spinipes]
MLIHYIVIVQILYFGKYVQGGRWVDIPEFSDEMKVYRTPFSTRENRYKFMRDNNFFHKQQDSAIYEEQTEIKIPSIHYSGVNVTRLSVPKENLETNKYFTNVSAENIDEDSCEVKDDSYKINKIFIKSNNTTETETHAPDTKMYNDKQTVFEEQLPPPTKYLNATQKEDKNTFLMYLPTEILKNVHQNLKSQPATIKGKLKFLKSFEKILSHDIESRLARFINPSRKKRGSHDHYDHGYDDYEDHSLGFPSLEGALMAISFLTFAVYLVRLVMLLFRNVNTGTQAAGATVLVGKKKRSMEQFDEDTARILHSVDNFAANI